MKQPDTVQSSGLFLTPEVTFHEIFYHGQRLLSRTNLEGDFIMQKTPKELMDGIMEMLKGNYRAMRLVYAFLVGLTGGVHNG